MPFRSAIVVPGSTRAGSQSVNRNRCASRARPRRISTMAPLDREDGTGTAPARQFDMSNEHIAGTETAAARQEARERWEISGGSTLEFVLRHLVIQEIRGRFSRWGGVVLIDREQPSRSAVAVWVELDSIETDSVERDAHVRSPEFLDVERYPRATFASTAVAVDDERIRVRGKLELHGIVHELELEVTPGSTSRDANGAAHCRYVAHGAINRQMYGLHWNQDLDVGGVVVGDRIELRATIDAVRIPDGRA